MDRLNKVLNLTCRKSHTGDLADYGGDIVTLRQFLIFLACGATDEPQTVRGLATQLGVNKPAITRTVNSFEALGMLKRTTDENDRRSVFISCTDKGRKCYEELAAIMA